MAIEEGKGGRIKTDLKGRLYSRKPWLQRARVRIRKGLKRKLKDIL